MATFYLLILFTYYFVLSLKNKYTIPYHTIPYHLQKTSPNVISPICFAIFISLFDSTLDSADCWSAHSDPITHAAARETASNMCANGAWLGGVGRVAPSKQKSWLRRWRTWTWRSPDGNTRNEIDYMGCTS